MTTKRTDIIHVIGLLANTRARLSVFYSDFAYDSNQNIIIETPPAVDLDLLQKASNELERASKEFHILHVHILHVDILNRPCGGEVNLQKQKYCNDDMYRPLYSKIISLIIAFFM